MVRLGLSLHKQMTERNSAILLTIDVEDWFQVENFRQYIPFSSWPDRELRVEKNTHRLLDLFDCVNMNRCSQLPSEYPSSAATLGRRGPQSEQSANNSKIDATFFVLGWIAERLPNLVREINNRGHEIASHGYSHKLCYKCSKEDLVKDIADSKKLLEDIIGDRVYGYRAPSFSVNDGALKDIERCGYLYDSSLNSFTLNKRYGKITFPEDGGKDIGIMISPGFYELPVSNLKIGARVLPWGGGGFFRLVPLPIFNIGVQHILARGGAYLMYLHPWEIDPAQPKLRGVSRVAKFRHYANITRTYSKLANMIENFSKCSFITCKQYLEELDA